MKISTQRVLAGLLISTLFTACNRPVAYFQKSPHEHFTATVSAPVLPASPSEVVVPVGPTVAAPAKISAEQASAALDQLEAVVRNDRSLAADKTVAKRLHRMRALLVPAVTKANPSSARSIASVKTSLLERMMLRKMNRNIHKHLAPAKPSKPMVSTGILAVGAVVAIVGLILILVGGSSSAGIILLLAGAVVLLLGLLL